MYGTVVWTDLGFADFTEGLTNKFVNATITESNTILVDNGLPSLIQTATVRFASVHVSLHGHTVDQATMRRAAEVLQAEVSAKRFNVTILNGTRSLTYTAQLWDGTTSTLINTTTAAPGDASPGSANGDDFLQKNSTVLIAVGAVLALVATAVVVMAIRVSTDGKRRRRSYASAFAQRVQPDAAAAAADGTILEPIDDFDMVQGALYGIANGGDMGGVGDGWPEPIDMAGPGAYPMPSPGVSAADQAYRPSYFDPAPSHFYPGPSDYGPTDDGGSVAAADDLRIRQLVEQARRHYYPGGGATSPSAGSDWPLPSANLSPQPNAGWPSHYE